MKQILLLSVLVLLALTIACGGSGEPTAPPPTPTPLIYPATFTPEIPQTPEPSPTPTGAIIPPTRTPDADTQKVTAAFVRTARIAAYHLKLTITVVDPFGTIPNVRPNQPFNALTVDGQLNQTESQWHITGQEVVSMGGDIEKGLDLLTVGGAVYVKGPATRLGAPAELWYATTLAPDTAQNQYPQTFFNKFADAVAAFPTMHAIQEETLDGEACIKYQSDEQEMSAFIFDLLNLPAEPLGSTRRDTLLVSVCDDGYVHHWEWNYEVTDPKSPDVKGTSKITMDLSGIKIIIPLQPPPDAIPAQNQVPLPAPNVLPFPKPTTTS